MRKSLIFLAYFLINITNSQSQWINQVIPSNIGDLYSIEFSDDNNAIACGRVFQGVGQGKALFTTNAGISWILANVPDSSRGFSMLKFVTPQTAFMSGSYNNRASFFKSTDAGRTWVLYGNVPVGFTTLSQMDFENINTGYVGALNPSPPARTTILKTTDGGLTWIQSFPIDSLSYIDKIKVLGLGVVIAAGRVEGANKGIILKSTNFGNDWSRTFFSSPRYFSGLDFSNASTGIAVGLSKILKTTNQGSSWFNVDSLAKTHIEGVDFYSGSGVGMIYGETGLFQNMFVKRTTDYGTTWSAFQIVDSTLTFLGVPLGGYLVSSTNVYLVGGNGSGGPDMAFIYHTTNGGSVFVNQISNELPNTFLLLQNYPNPFNPTTIIEFSLPEKSLIKLKVFDVLGKQIAELVNENLTVGTYKVDFDASTYLSGVYFYTLEAEKFTETKRMVLLK